MKYVSAVQAFINLGKMDNIKVSLQHVSGKVNRMCKLGFIVVQLKLLAEVLFFTYYGRYTQFGSHASLLSSPLEQNEKSINVVMQ